MLYQATHTTRYLYEAPVAQCFSEARLTPRELPHQHLHTSRIQVEPEPVHFDQRTDYFGNQVSSFAIFRNHEKFTTTAVSVVEVNPRSVPPAAIVADSVISWEQTRDRLAVHTDDADMAAYEYVFDSPYVAAGPEFVQFARPTFTAGRPLAQAALELCQRIYSEFSYLPKSTSIHMPLLEILRNKCGVCQDYTHIMIAALRSLRLPARYVSGYLRSGAQYQGAEASHAWVSVYIPDCGWLDFDPTNNLMPAEGHVTLAWGRDFGDVSPVNGIALGGGHQTVEVEVRVQPITTPAESR